ncbi:MAG: NAD-dependent epimerase/dehydratase family protein [Planctomycetes bacterium]|nr:NAD-dependent epimerase/dehydratase family protein [Planctomycetota bacterium]
MGEAPRRVAITGVDGFWGRELALALAGDVGVERIVALGEKRPAFGLDRMEFVQIDLLHPMLVEVLASHGVEAVCHLGPERRGRLDEDAFQKNVLGTMHLASAAANVGARKFVYQSSIRAYGARHDNPSFIPETRRVAKGMEYPENRDLYEIERYLEEFAGKRPEVGVVVLRFAWILGPVAGTPFSRTLDLPAVPTLLGFDPHFQFIHERDVVRALAHAVRSLERGVFNVAADGVVPLSRVLRKAGKLPVPNPHPLAYGAARVLARLGIDEPFPIEVDFLRYSVVADTRRMQAEMAFEPEHSADATIESYVRRRRRRNAGRALGFLDAVGRGAERFFRRLPGSAKSLSRKKSG